MDKKRVLIFPCGAVNALEIKDALKYNLHFEVFGATSISDHSEFRYKDENLIIRRLHIKDENFIEKFNEVIREYKIDFVYPTHDEISKYLIECQPQINATIICSPIETARIAEDKYLTWQSLKDSGIYPKVYKVDEIKEEDLPLFVKPRIGAGGKGSFVLDDLNNLNNKNLNQDKYLICEYLPGEEITVDCFTNYKRELVFCGARSRERIEQGITRRSRRVPLNDEILRIANILNDKLHFRGGWFFQLKKDKNNEFKLLEISIRAAGTSAFYRQLGINFPLLTLFDFMGYETNILFNDFDIILDRGVETLYKFNYEYDKLFIDFDDTLIVNGKVNTKALRLIYQCANDDKRIYLISRHEKDIYQSLKEYKIDKNLFEKIVVLNKTDKKSKYICSEKSIFIDNYYFDRKEVKDNIVIPVFDVNVIDCLIDESEF